MGEIQRWFARKSEGRIVHYPHTRGEWVRFEDYEAAESRCKELEARLLENGGNLVPIAPEVRRELDRRWSRPVELAIKDGELLVRTSAETLAEADTGLQEDARG